MCFYDRSLRRLRSHHAHPIVLLALTVAVYNCCVFEDCATARAGGVDDGTTRQVAKWTVTALGDCHDRMAFPYFSAQHRLILAIDSNPPQIWDTRRGERVAILHEQRRGMDDCAVSPEGTRLITLDRLGGWWPDVRPRAKFTRAVWVWDLNTGKRLKKIDVDLTGKDTPWCTDWQVRSWRKNRLVLQLNSRENPAHASICTVFMSLDLVTGKVVRKSGIVDVGESLVLSPDGKRAVGGLEYGVWRDEDGEITWGGRGTTYEVPLLDMETFKVIAMLDKRHGTPDGRSIVHRVWSADGHYVATVGSDHTARIWEGDRGRLVSSIKGHSESILDVCFSPDARMLLTGSDDDTALVWETSTGKLLRTLAGHTAGLNSVAFDSSGHRILTGAEDETARLWDTATGKLLRSWEGHESAVRKVRFRDGGTKVFTRTVGGMERIWSAQDGSKLSERRTTGSRYNRFGVLFLKDDNHHVEVWAGPPGAPGEEASGPQQRLALRSSLIGHSASRAVAVSPDGKLIVTVGRGNTLLLWDPARWDKVTGRGRVRLGAFTKSIESLAFGPAGRTLAVGTEEGIVSLWDVFAKRQTFRLSAHAGAVKGLAFSPDGRVLASGGEDRAVILWNVRTGKPQLTITGRTGAIRCLAFSPNGQLLASGGTIRDWTDKERNEFYRPGEVKLWDTKTGKELATLRGYGATVTCLGFTPDGRTLAAASDDKTLRLWDLATCKQQALLRGDDECFSSLAFSPDGKLLASGHYWTKGSVELWDVHDRSEICRFVPHAYTVYQLAFTPDCKTLISGSNDGTVKFWDVHTVCQRKRSK